MAEALAHRYEIPRISNPPEPSLKLSSLPIDILLEICSYLAPPCLLVFTILSRSMLSTLRPFMDHLVRAYTLRNEPWLLPPDDGGAGGDTMHTAEKLNRNALTWAAYLKACRESASMKNRARIWGISRKLAEMADELGIAHL